MALFIAGNNFPTISAINIGLEKVRDFARLLTFAHETGDGFGVQLRVVVYLGDLGHPVGQIQLLIELIMQNKNLVIHSDDQHYRF